MDRREMENIERIEVRPAPGQSLDDWYESARVAFDEADRYGMPSVRLQLERLASIYASRNDRGYVALTVEEATELARFAIRTRRFKETLSESDADRKAALIFKHEPPELAELRHRPY